MKLTTTSDLLIPQWRQSPRLVGMVDGIIDIVQKEVMDNLERIEEMWHIDTAVGGWLDLIGLRVGIERPMVVGQGTDKKFGFKNVNRAKSFDQAPFKGVLSTESRYPISDSLFRKLIKARGVAITSSGNFDSFDRSAKKLDPECKCKDNRNMTATISTDEVDLFKIADRLGAIARPAGVGIVYTGSRRFGFDEAGEGFDRVPYK